MIKAKIDGGSVHVELEGEQSIIECEIAEFVNGVYKAMCEKNEEIGKHFKEFFKYLAETDFLFCDVEKDGEEILKKIMIQDIEKFLKKHRGN